ncbi:hypothetical protein CDD83_6584 [Cordyceps sp. RAO-2017]|nr:hypothetical protein CDD83_6584 [Cordyceps sp. RAO-2017]
MLCTRCLRAAASRWRPSCARPFSAFPPSRSAEPALSTPVSKAGEAPPKPAATPRSACPEGTVLTGLSYTKGVPDPVALKDEDYPEWLWSCLDVMKKSSEEDGGIGDEFSKSKKVRRQAAKRQKAAEAKLMAEGNLEALAPKVPLQHQSINLPGEEGGSVEDNIAAAEARALLKKAMRKERKAKIKESNFLRSM